MGSGWPARRPGTWPGLALAVAGPVVLTAVLAQFGTPQPRDYVFLYLGVVSLLGVGRGLGPALLSAAVSFLLVDWFSVPPLHTLTIAGQQDVVNLVVFLGAALLVGGVGSRRRRSQLAAEALSRQLRRANAELERLNREQAEAAAVAVRLARTEQQVRVLEESDRVRREFLANVSHELRTPLGSILTNSTGLLAHPALAPELRDEVDSIAVEARRLDRLVGDMLDMARIEGNALELHLEAVDAGAAAEAAFDRLHVVSPARRLEWRAEAPEPVCVLADWGRLGQVLDNLLHNADRIAPAGTPVEVSAVQGARSMVVLRVIDHGPGIPEELRDRLFTRFARGHGDDGTVGAGLGLAIVRGLVEAHAGRVWVEDTPGGGATFAVSLPAAPP